MINNLEILETGNFMLDGGAMFGVVPKVMWQKVYPANEKNLCNLSMRALLLDTGDRKIMIDAGIGTKQDEKFYSYYYLNGDYSLDQSLERAGYQKSDITDVILTHLHFDHCGGAVERNADKSGYQLTFPNATYWVSISQWEWAMSPNQREKASYLPENINPIAESGRLKLFSNNFKPVPEIELRLFNGHTAGLAVPIIQYQGNTLIYTTDIFPTMAHIPLSWVCGFDTQPLQSFTDREILLKEALDRNYILFFEHDVYVQSCRLEMTQKGIRGCNAGDLRDLL